MMGDIVVDILEEYIFQMVVRFWCVIDYYFKIFVYYFVLFNFVIVMQGNLGCFVESIFNYIVYGYICGKLGVVVDICGFLVW